MKVMSPQATSKMLSEFLVKNPYANIPQLEVFNPEVLALYKEWRYSFKEWCRTVGFLPVALVNQVVFDESYEKHECHLFRLSSGYATVTEEGCSCYEASWAVIDMVKTRREGEKVLQAYKDGWRR